MRTRTVCYTNSHPAARIGRLRSANTNHRCTSPTSEGNEGNLHIDRGIREWKEVSLIIFSGLPYILKIFSTGMAIPVPQRAENEFLLNHASLYSEINMIFKVNLI